MPSKLGPHVLAGRPELPEFVKSGGRLVKLVSNKPGQDWLQHNPNVLILGRWYDPLTAGEQWRGGIDPKKAAADYVKMQEQHYKEMPEILYWEGHNEPSFGAPTDDGAIDGMTWYANFEAERTRILATMGLRSIVGNFSTGYPEVQHDNSLWEAFLPALEAAFEHKGILGVHEYGGPFMWSGWGPFNTGVEHGDCGKYEVEDDSGWLCLRYRKIHRLILAPRGMGRLPIAITENGTDSVGTWCEPMFSGPWHRIKGRWNEWDGSTDPIDYWRGPERDVEIFYAEQLIWYDKQMQKDPYCVGSTIFTLGNYGSPWDEFELSDTKAVRRILEHIKSDPWVGETDPWKVVEALPDELFDGTGIEIAPPPPPPDDGKKDEIILPPLPPSPPGDNLLTNPSFEEGSQSHAVGQIPQGWGFWFAPESEPKISGQDQNWMQPQAQLYSMDQATEDEKGELFLEGRACFRVFGAWRPIWFRLSQKVTGLTPNARYRLTMPIYPELVTGLDQGRKVFADDTAAGETRMGVRVSGRMVETGWKDGSALPFGKYSDLTLEFSPPTSEVEVFVEGRGRWGLQHNGFCIDSARLNQIAPPREGGRPDLALIQPIGENLLRNPGLEDLTRNPGNYTPDLDHNHYQNGFIRRSNSSWSPNEWPTWWVEGKGIPEFTVPQQPIKEKIRSGNRAMGVFKQWDKFNAGWWQEVDVEKGATYRAEAWCRIWATQDDNPPFMGGTPAELYTGVGITTDPSPYPEPNRATGDLGSYEGGKLPSPPNLLFKQDADWHIQDWQKLSLEFVAPASRIGVIFYVDAPWGVQTQDVYYDDVSLVKLAGVTPPPPPPPPAGNLLQNADFSGGVYQPKAVLPTLQVPDGWTFWYAGARTPRVEGQQEAWRDPKTSVITPANASADDKDAFIGGVQRVFRVVGAWRAIWWALTQKVAGLEPNQRYRFSVTMFPNPVLGYEAGGKKTYVNQPQAGEIWLKSISGGRKTETLRHVHQEVSVEGYSVLTHDFTPTHSSADLTLEVRARFALVQSAWYVAEASLTML